MHKERKSGILLHPTSLPGPGGIGTMGQSARAFADFLHASGQSIWQILPTGPTTYGHSPYACYSAFAGNPLLIDLQALVWDGDLESSDLLHDLPDERVDYQRVEKVKAGILKKAAVGFFTAGDTTRREEFRSFCEANSWLNDFAMFMALKEHYHGRCWNKWPEPVAGREASALDELSRELAGPIDDQKYMQWQFFRQWRGVKEYANRLGIGIFGDIPIFVAYDSADVWANRQLFLLDEKGRPTVVAGVPPDYFSSTGQLWGNPLYDWDAMASNGYGWWIERFRCSFAICDMVRIDHFRGFESHWEVPATEKTAVNGRWAPGPGDALFYAVEGALGQLPIIAEDLGVITPEVEELRDRFSFPGMKILQFAFGSGPQNPYLPHNHIRECVVYTGTHDNDTTVGWFASLAEHEKKDVCRYLHTPGNDIAWELIRSCLVSVADTVIFPLQDLLSLDSKARMNTPGTSAGNWAWRFSADALTPDLAGKLLELTEIYGRKQ
jgi:4-alpha-glucanotransferase